MDHGPWLPAMAVGLKIRRRGRPLSFPGNPSMFASISLEADGQSYDRVRGHGKPWAMGHGLMGPSEAF